MDNLTEQAPNAITVTQIEEMTTQEIKETLQTGRPNWMTTQNLALVLADRCITLEPPTLDLPAAA